MGAEGSPWIGAANFVRSDHFTQNVGDGTFFHSGSQSLRATIAAGVNITFKLLYNGHIAMTGGQRPEGFQDLKRLVRYLDAEGVGRIIVVTDDRAGTLGEGLPRSIKVYGRDRYEQAVKELAATPGTTVLVFDQECAAEVRRARKRGRLPEPEKFIVINEHVCEGCGDCGDVSNCMSVVPVDTELGRKTQIHQASCNKDYSCVRGDCPAFVTVYSDNGLRTPTPPPIEAGSLPSPARSTDTGDPYRMLLTGIGGTGVITVSHVLAYAAILDGFEVDLLGQTGLAQKGGSVVGSITLYGRGRPQFTAHRIPAGKADVVLAFDPVALAAPYNADRMSPQHTIVVGDQTIQPTADAVRHVDFVMPSAAALQAEIGRFSLAGSNSWIDATRVSEQLFADAFLTNVFMLGYACQGGLIPLSVDSIERAFVLNGAAVDRNLQAFRYGRVMRHDPIQIQQRIATASGGFAGAGVESPSRVGGIGPRGERLLRECVGLSEEAQRLITYRVGELIAYQDVQYAERYVSAIIRVRTRESAVIGERDDVTRAAIRSMYKLMAYKDEYEVARLLLKSPAAESVRGMFRPGARFAFNLHPPVLRDHGLKRKLELGGWFRPVLSLLIPMRRIRGTRLDPFGRTAVRRTERELIGWYAAVLDAVLDHLAPETYTLAVAIASSPDRIRGYEGIKLTTVAATKDTVERQLREYVAAGKGVPVRWEKQLPPVRSPADPLVSSNG
jgi:indolepyruvate ferredoxin oxidoreductase